MYLFGFSLFCFLFPLAAFFFFLSLSSCCLRGEEGSHVRFRIPQLRKERRTRGRLCHSFRSISYHRLSPSFPTPNQACERLTLSKWALAWLQVYDLTNDPRYLTTAAEIFEDLTTGLNATCGGQWWDKAHTASNSESVQPSFSLAFLV